MQPYKNPLFSGAPSYSLWGNLRATQEGGANTPLILEFGAIARR